MGKAATGKTHGRGAKGSKPVNYGKESSARFGVIVGLLVALIVIGGTVGIIVGTNTASPAPVATAEEQLTPKNVTAEGAFHITTEGVVAPTAERQAGAVRLDMFIDPQCPACGLVERGIGDEVKKLVDTGAVDLYLTPVSFLDRASSDRYSTRATNALITVAEDAPAQTLPFMQALFTEENQPGEGGAYRPVSAEKLASIAESVGVPSDVASTFGEGRYITWVEEHTEKQLARTDLFPDGFATPGVFFNVVYENGRALPGFQKVIFNSADTLSTFQSAYTAAKEA
jgi:protein-disulfide isomerase